jgi:hypothetical protein
MRRFVLLQFLNVRQSVGRAIAEAVSRWLPTAAARVWQVGFVVDKVASRQLFSEYFGFPCQKQFHSTNFSIIITITRGS